jgi:NAD(P)-dependent dehydrogenase (short-subunit alcohol dehydrogenase family)
MLAVDGKIRAGTNVGDPARARNCWVFSDDARGAARHDRRRRRLDRLHLVDLGSGSDANEVLYDTTKGACHMFARAIAVEFRDRYIRRSAVQPRPDGTAADNNSGRKL